MELDSNKSLEMLGEKVGYIAGYLVFTTALFFVLTLLSKLPANFSYLHVALITLTITVIGSSIKKML